MNPNIVVIRPAADRDLDEHFDHIAQDSLDAALRLLEAARVTFEELARTPGTGKLRPVNNPRLRGLRQWRIRGFPRYQIYYREIEQGIEVLRVLYGSRDIDSILEEE